MTDRRGFLGALAALVAVPFARVRDNSPWAQIRRSYGRLKAIRSLA